MKEPIIVQTNIRSKVRLDDKYDFIGHLTIGLAEGGDFYVAINFRELSIQDFKVLVQLSKENRRLAIKSELFDKEKYMITHILLEKHSASTSTMNWECLSDDPDLYSMK